MSPVWTGQREMRNESEVALHVGVCGGTLRGRPGGGAVLLLVGSIDVEGYSTAGLIPLGLSLGAAVEGVLVCSLAGALGSLTPLIRALRLHPAQALRAL